MTLTKSLFILLSICIFNTLVAQENKASVILGACASQIHGDRLGGYNKLGYTIGVSVERELQNNLVFQPEIIFNKRGSSTSSKDFYDYTITLKYLDIPILLGYKINNLFTSQTGLSFGRLISSSDSFSNSEYDSIKNLDYRLMAGIEYNALEKISIKMRYAISLVNIGKTGNLQNDSVDFLFLFYFN